MMDRDKVIKGLECCTYAKLPIPCDKCDYFGNDEYNDPWSCRISLMRDALTLLKAQEPREMKLEEIKQAAAGGCMYWMELKEKYACFPVLMIEQKANGIIEFGAILDRGYGPVTVGRFRPDEYNTFWRCWTSRPTDEQRKAVKWDAAD